MAYDLVIGGTQQVDLATTQGWVAVKRWGAKLDEDEFDELLQLVEHGLSQDLPALQTQLMKAISDVPPETSVAKTLASIVKALKARSADAESAFVTDGMGPDDGEEDWESS